MGVAYYFIRSFGLSWEWEEIRSWQGIISGGGPIVDLLPLIILVTLSSLCAYLLVTQGVRKYRRYLDSGLDYKDLLMSLKSIDDLDNKEQVNKLRHHYELREFLMRVKDEFQQRQHHIAEREKALEGSVKKAEQSREREISERLAAECEALATAIENGSIQINSEQIDGLTFEELKRIEDTVRNALRNQPAALTDRAPQAGEESFSNLKQASALMHNKIQEISTELKESGETAREIEENLKAAAGDEPEDGGFDKNEIERRTHELLVSYDSLDKMASSIGALSEEAKGVAISTALQAGSGKGTPADLVEFAENVKDMAVRLNDLAKSHHGLAGDMRSSVNQFEEHFQRVAVGQTSPGASQSVAALAGKMSLWVERMMILSDKMKNVEETYDLSVRSIQGVEGDPDIALGADYSGTPADTNEFKFDTANRESSILSGDTAETEELPGIQRQDRGIFEQASTVDEMFEDLSGRKVAEGSSGQEDSADFEDLAQNDGSDAKAPDEEDIRADFEIAEHQDARVNIEEPAEQDTRADFEETEPGGDIEYPRTEFDPNSIDFDDTGIGDFVKERGPESPVNKVPVEKEDAVDLYALGAVDYDPALHSTAN
jgi:hypothetical protein